MPQDVARGSLRELTREAVRARISDAAIELFDEHGFDQVTVEQIAAHVGISTRSFNRYFPAKEDAVIGDTTPWGDALCHELLARPADEPAWESLRISFQTFLSIAGSHDERQKRSIRVLNTAPSLRARNLEKHLQWEQRLTPIIAARLDDDDAQLRARTIVQASLTCFDVAVATWAEPDETRSPAELVAVCFAALQQP